MKRTLAAALAAFALASSLQATVISGRISDLTGQTLTTNRSVTFELKNCGNNIPRVVGSSVIAPASRMVVPNAAGLLAGTLIGNDVIECGTVVGQTYYLVSIFAGTQKVYEKNFFIQGATWNIATAVPLNNDPTGFLTYTGYQLGDLIYGSGVNTLSVLRGNNSTIRKYLCMLGDGASPGPPSWCDLDPASIPEPTSLPQLSGDISNSGGPSTQLTVSTVGGVTASAIGTATLLANAATSLNTASTIVKRDGNGDFTARRITAALIGNADTATKANALATDPAACASGQWVYDIASTGALACKALAASDMPSSIDAAKIGSGAVSNTIFGYLANVTSDVQGQINTHTHADGSMIQKILVYANGTLAGTRKAINLIPGTNFAISAADNPGSDRVDVTLSAQLSSPTFTGSVAIADATQALLTLQTGGENAKARIFQAVGNNHGRLDLSANARFDNTSGTWLRDDTNAPAFSINLNPTTGYGYLRATPSGSNPVSMWADALTWDATGLVTIPGNLTVNGTFTGTVAWSSISGKPTAVSSFSNDSGYYKSGDSATFNILSASKLALGTPTPDYSLVINSGYGGGVIRIGGEGDWLNRIKSDTHLALQTAVGGDILFMPGSATAETGRITPVGLMLGTSSATDKLNVGVGGWAPNMNGGIRIQATGNEAGTRLAYKTDGSGVGRFAIDMWTSSGSPTERFIIDEYMDTRIGGAAGRNTLRYFDIYNQDDGASSGVDLRLITKNAAGTGSAIVDMVKYKSGAFIISNSEGQIALNASLVGTNNAFQVNGGSDPGTAIGFWQENTGSYLSHIAGYQLSFSTGDNNARTERMRIESNGMVLVTRDGPGVPLMRLKNTNSGGYTGIDFINYNSEDGLGGIGRGGPTAASFASNIYLWSSTDLIFATGGTTERMRIKNDGTISALGTLYAPIMGKGDTTTFQGLKYMLQPGDGNGVCFWGDCDNYKISFGNADEYHYGPVTGYSIKSGMNQSYLGWGFTWGPQGGAPVAGLRSDTGDMQVAGYMLASKLEVTASNAYLHGDGSGMGVTGGYFYTDGTYYANAVINARGGIQNDQGTLTISGATNFTQQPTVNSSPLMLQSQAKSLSFVLGGDPNVLIAATTIYNFWRAHAFQMTVTELGCAVDAGSVTLELLRSDGGVVSTATCSATGLNGGAMSAGSAITGYGWIPWNYGLGIRTSSVSGVHNLSVSVKFTPSY
jgi:hypothetical protein